MAGRTYLFAISLGVHAALGAALVAIPARTRREIIAISMSETTKPKPVVHTEPPPPEPLEAVRHPLRAKAAAPPPKAAEVAPANAAIACAVMSGALSWGQWPMASSVTSSLPSIRCWT